MEELSRILMNILSELKTMNENLDSIDEQIWGVKNGLQYLQGSGTWNTLSDLHDKIDKSTAAICTKMNEIKGPGPWDSISDLYEKLDSIYDR